MPYPKEPEVARRRRPQVLAGYSLIIALCLTAVVAVVVTIDLSTRSEQSLGANCSSSPPPAGRVREQSRYRALDAKQLIPGTPRGLVVCRYQGSESTEWRLKLQANIPVAHHDIAHVVKTTRVPLTPGDHGCPLVAASRQTYLIARFADAPDLVTWIRDNCGVAGNGTLIGAFTSRPAESAILATLPRH